MAAKLKPKRAFIDSIENANSWYKLNIDDYDKGINLTLADCNRSITWYFGEPGSKKGKARGKKKSAILKKLFDEIYEYYHAE